MANPCSWIARKWNGLRHSQDGSEIESCIFLFEMLLGIRPFIVHYPPDALRPRLKIYWLGLACTCVHVGIFLFCCTMVLYLDPFSSEAISGDELNSIETDFLAWLRCLDTFVIFTQIFIYRYRDLHLATLHRKIAYQFAHIDTDMTIVYRKMFYHLMAAFVSVVSSWVAIFVYQGYFMRAQMAGEPVELVVIVTVTAVMPFFYVQVIIVQYCLTVNMICMKLDKVNEVLGALCHEEVVAGNYQLGCY